MNTEAEAAELWCPMARYTYGGTSHNRHFHPDEPGIIPPSCLCIGGKCAAWRWQGHVEKWMDGTIHTASGHAPLGYCGLAGAVK